LGDSKTSLYFLIFSSVTNVILDYVAVVFLDMGVAGVAWATFIAQGVAGALSVVTLLRHLKRIETDGRYKIFSVSVLRKMARISIPSVLQQSFVSVGNVFIQKLINGFGSSVVAGYSAAIKLNTFTINALYTFGNGVSSFTAQNFGAKNLTRVRASLKIALLCATVLGSLCFILVEAFPETVLRIYMDVNDTIVAIGPRIMRIYMLALPIVGVTLAASFYFQSILKQWMSFTVAILRGLLLPISLVIILPATFGIDAIWWCMPISEAISFVISGVFLLIANRGLNKSADELMHEVTV
jgi:Na+-driven multidrug efflux pump